MWATKAQLLVLTWTEEWCQHSCSLWGQLKPSLRLCDGPSSPSAPSCFLPPHPHMLIQKVPPSKWPENYLLVSTQGRCLWDYQPMIRLKAWTNVLTLKSGERHRAHFTYIGMVRSCFMYDMQLLNILLLTYFTSLSFCHIQIYTEQNEEPMEFQERRQFFMWIIDGIILPQGIYKIMRGYIT